MGRKLSNRFLTALIAVTTLTTVSMRSASTHVTDVHDQAITPETGELATHTPTNAPLSHDKTDAMLREAFKTSARALAERMEKAVLGI